MKKLRILHVISHFYPMLGYQETFLAKMHSRTNTTLVITSNRFSKALYTANKNLLKKKVVGTGYFVENGIKVLRLPALFDIPPFETPGLVGLKQAVVNFKPDTIIVHNIVSIVSIQIARLKSRLPDTKFIFDDHMAYNATRGGWTRLAYLIFKKIYTPVLLKAADAFVAVASESKNFMEKEYGIPRGRIKIISLGADRNIFRFNVNDRLFIRRKYRIVDSDVVFIYVGKSIPEKGPHLLVQAGISLCKKHPHVRMMLVGGGYDDYVEKLKGKIRESGLVDKFIFVEPVPNQELPKYYSAADVGVWPLQASICMIEATSCKLPIIVSDGSRATERVSRGNGLLYREGDINDLERKMEELLDERRRKFMAENAETLDWENLAQRFLET